LPTGLLDPSVAEGMASVRRAASGVRRQVARYLDGSARRRGHQDRSALHSEGWRSFSMQN